MKRADAAAARCKAKVRNWRPDTEAQTVAKGKRRNQIVTSTDLNAAPKHGSAAPLQNARSGAANEQFHRPGDRRRAGTGPVRAATPAELETV